MTERNDATNEDRSRAETRQADGGFDKFHLKDAARDFSSYASIFAGAGMAFTGARNFGRKGAIVVGAGLMILGGRMLYKAMTIKDDAAL